MCSVLKTRKRTRIKLDFHQFFETVSVMQSLSFQVVAEIGSRIVIASSAILFFISNQDLPFILEVAQRVNPGLK